MPDPTTSMWVEWRRERAAGHRRAGSAWAAADLRLRSPAAGAPQCAMCWGQRMIWEPGPLGLLPVRCDGCLGTGRRLG
jgi:hypothetical protein